MVKFAVAFCISNHTSAKMGPNYITFIEQKDGVVATERWARPGNAIPLTSHANSVQVKFVLGIVLWCFT